MTPEHRGSAGQPNVGASTAPGGYGYGWVVGQQSRHQYRRKSRARPKAADPTKNCSAPDEENKRQFERPKVSKSLFDRLGANGFSGNVSAHGNPKFSDYAFGPEYSVGGFQVGGGMRIDLRRRAANFIDVTVGAEIGSCPDLLSWNGRHREWIDHGKVLDKAPSKEREYTETRISTGFTSRLRIEEREPEVAFIDHVGVAIALRTGETLTLKPDNPSLVARDGDYLRLYSGDAIEIRIRVTRRHCRRGCDGKVNASLYPGYYLRYSELGARRQEEPRTSPGPSRCTAPIARSPRPHRLPIRSAWRRASCARR